MEQRRNVQGWGKREILGKTRRPVASSGAIPTCENPGSNKVRLGGRRAGRGELNLEPLPLPALFWPLAKTVYDHNTGLHSLAPCTGKGGGGGGARQFVASGDVAIHDFSASRGMVGSYKRKSFRQSWEEVAMQRAIYEVNKGEIDWLRAAKTLDDTGYYSQASFNGVSKGLNRFHPTFDAALERELTYYDQEVTKWFKNHFGRTVSQYQISKLFSAAYGKAATLVIPESGFQNTGFWPVNPDIFPDHMFGPAETSIPLPLEDEPQTIPVWSQDTQDLLCIEIIHYRVIDPCDEDDIQDEDSHTQENHQKSSFSNLGDDNGANNDSQSAPPMHVSVATISPLPKATTSGQKQKCKVNRAPAVVTTSPYLQESKKKVADKKVKEQWKSAQKVRKQLKMDKEISYEEKLFTDDANDDYPSLDSSPHLEERPAKLTDHHRPHRAQPV
ncbi:hypothetical protein PR048_010187 [Dryococelus australis]|uniref:Uncharacterized protein n=1 Tax=Dryococelus australis TaxID=614101 RepID=A0ABQ9I3Y8_9NEOP|nr:hypothetical protein PR048_010187 [Dryococelus australis]